MRRLWIAAGLLAVLLGGSLVNGWYARTLTGSLWERLEQAQALVDAGDWEQAEELTARVYDDWNAGHSYLHIVMRHGDTDEILRSFRAVLWYLKLEEMDQYAAANADLIAQLQLLSEMEQPSLVNVL